MIEPRTHKPKTQINGESRTHAPSDRWSPSGLTQRWLEKRIVRIFSLVLASVLLMKRVVEEEEEERVVVEEEDERGAGER